MPATGTAALCLARRSGAYAVGAALAAWLLAACPLSHDEYETDRPCWSHPDCVSLERCVLPDGGAIEPGECRRPSDGPCGFDGGIYCFEDDAGVATSCSLDPAAGCAECQQDAGPLPDGGCPPDLCLSWEDLWTCQ